MAIVCSLVVLEALSWLGLHLLNLRYPMDPMGAITPASVNSFLDGTNRLWQYDADLGWTGRQNSRAGPINSLGARSRHEYHNLRHTISAYGDSYTFCHGASVDDAWPTLLESRLNVGVLNFGGTGYGTDQALLCLEKQYDRAPSSTVLLCIQPENINRVVSIFKGFYESGFAPPKPRFILKAGGMELFNPWKTPEAVRDILIDHPEKLLEMARRYDYWFGYGAALGAGAPWQIRFPYSYRLAARVPFLYSRVRIAVTNRAAHTALYDPNCEAFAVMKAIILRFRAFASAKGSNGLVVILPPPRDIYRFAEHGELTYQSLHDFLNEERIPFTDLIEELAGEPDIPASFVNRSDHYSRKGSEIAAREIAAFLARENAVPRPTLSSGTPARTTTTLPVSP
ncbi:MAG TPA: SGNH/GDSL hydrolase family protein [Phycisphaerae bacterium]|nr:SGNH/GDSL hydrolase family protein [Phycisphaerae bacterium]